MRKRRKRQIQDLAIRVTVEEILEDLLYTGPPTVHRLVVRRSA